MQHGFFHLFDYLSELTQGTHPFQFSTNADDTEPSSLTQVVPLTPNIDKELSISFRNVRNVLRNCFLTAITRIGADGCRYEQLMALFMESNCDGPLLLCRAASRMIMII